MTGDWRLTQKEKFIFLLVLTFFLLVLALASSNLLIKIISGTIAFVISVYETIELSKRSLR